LILWWQKQQKWGEIP